MTEKRFTYNEFEDCIIDNLTDKTYWGLDDILNNKLNEFYEENQELKKRLKALDDAFMDFEQKLYLEVFDIQLSKEDEKTICELNNLILKNLTNKEE